MKKLWQKMRSIGFVYIVGGLILSGGAALLIMGAASGATQYLTGNSILKRGLTLILAGIVSLLILVLLEKHFISSRFRKLSNYYIMASVIAFVAALLVMDLLSTAANALGLDPNLSDAPTSEQLLRTIVLLILLLGAGISSFLILFGKMTKNKSEYISRICEDVGRLAEDSDNVVIEEKGGDELEKISRSINRMSAELREKRRRELELERQRSELITNVSHDLRSPLTSIIGYVRLLRENGCRDEQKFNEYIEVTDRRLEGLSRLVNELFELTRLDSPDLTLNSEEGDLSGLVRQFGFEMGLILEQEGFSLECDTDENPYMMQLDYERFARVMQNLFANVIKYAAPGTNVRYTSRISGGEMEISLSNRLAEGARVDTANMFDRFYKEDSARSDTSGAGLGLAIAKRIVELHGGSITAETDKGELTVRIKLSAGSPARD